MPTTTSPALDDLVEEFLAAFRRGEQPAIEDYVARYPDLASQIREIFPTLLAMEELGPESAVSPSLGNAACLAKPEIPSMLGEYRIIRELGRGGMGIVFEALQESLGRHVALKVLPPQATLHRANLDRFRREAQAAARLHHSNIVPVFGVGEHAGIRFFAMQYIAGQPLDAVLHEVRRLRNAGSAEEPVGGETVSACSQLAAWLQTGRFLQGPAPSAVDPHAVTSSMEAQTTASVTPAVRPVLSGGSPRRQDYFREIARLAMQVAEALAYAHRQGVIHRDIKPSNLLLDLEGNVWITDFGLAKASGSDELTQTGDVMGTLRYMAPEQMEGHTDARSDLYSLGITLYEMVTLTPAFGDPIKARLIDRVKQEEPTRPRKLEPQIPGDLEIIILKAIAKEPNHRYADAEAMAADLRRFLEDRPIRARRVLWVERSWRWARRNPGVAVLSGLLLGSLLAGAAISLTLGWRADRRAKEALAAKTEADRDFHRLLEVVDGLLVDGAEKHFRDVPHLEPERKRLLEQALHFFDRMQQDRRDSALVKERTAETALRVCRLRYQMNQLDEAADAARRVIEHSLVLAAAEPGSSKHFRRLVSAYSFLSSIHSIHGDQQAAEHALDEMARWSEQWLAADATSSEARLELLLARLYSAQNHRLQPEADERFRAVLVELDQLIPAEADRAAHSYRLARGHRFHADLLRQLPGRKEAGLEANRKALAFAARAVEASPANWSYRYEWGMATRDLAKRLGELSRKGESEKHWNHAWAEFRQLANLQPAVPAIRYSLAEASLHVAIAQQPQSPIRAQELLDAALKELRSIAEGARDRNEHSVLEGRLHLQVAEGQRLLKRPQAAETSVRRALASFSGATRPSHSPWLLSLRRASAEMTLADLLLGRKEHDQAMAAADRSMKLMEEVLQARPREPGTVYVFADLHRIQWQSLIARKQYEQAAKVNPPLIDWLETQAKNVDEETSHVVGLLQSQRGAALHHHGVALTLAGQFEQARLAFDEAIASQRMAVAGNPTDNERLMFLQNHYERKAALLSGKLARHAEADAVFAEAQGTFAKLAEAHPKRIEPRLWHAQCHYWRSRLLRDRGDVDGALTSAKEAIRLHLQAASLPDATMRHERMRNEAVLNAARLLVDRGSHAAAAELLKDVVLNELETHHSWAGLLCRCIGAAEKDPELAAEMRSRLRYRYGDQAMLLLREAVRLGFRNPDEYRTNAFLEPLRERPDFQRLLREMENPRPNSRNP